MKRKLLLGLIPLLFVTISGCSGNKKSSPISSEEQPSSSEAPSSSEVPPEPIDNRITIDFDLNGGSSPSYSGPIKVETFTTDVFFFDVTREDWNFRGWEYNGVKIFDEKGHQLANPEVAKSMTFKAIFLQTVRLTITKNIEEAGTISGEGEYPYNTNVDIATLVNDGYRFEGWYADGTLIATNENYNFKMWSTDVTIEARFTYLKHELIVKSNNVSKGTVMIQGESHVAYVESDSEDVNYLEQVTIVANTLTNTRFLGWYNEDNELVDTNAVYTFVMPDEDVTYTAMWNYFTVEYVLNDGTIEEDVVDHYTIDEEAFLIYNPTKAGYTFDGWKVVLGDRYTLLGTGNAYFPTHLMEDLVFIANYRETINHLILSSNDDSRGTVSLVSGVGEYNTSVRVRAVPESGYVFKGWYNVDTQKMVSNVDDFTYGMPSSGQLHLEAQFMSVEEIGTKPVKNGKTITYGLYPKTKVTNQELIAILNSGGGIYNGDETYYWNLGFYRLYDSNYYKCERVRWNCLDAMNRLYVSQDILNVSSYYSLEVLHPTRYSSSTLQAMLDYEIFSEMFKFGQNYIELSTVNNASDTTDNENNPYSPKSGDAGYNLPVQHSFALSYQDLIDNNLGFSSNPNATKTRQAVATDFAKARGLESDTYWTRSPVSSAQTESQVWSVDATGKLVASSVEDKLGNRPVIKFTSAIDAL